MNLQNEDAIKEQEMHIPQSITESWVRPETPQKKGVEHSLHSVTDLFKYSIHTTSRQKQNITDIGQMEGRTDRLMASNLIS